MTTDLTHIGYAVANLAPGGRWLWHGIGSWAQTLRSTLKVLAAIPPVGTQGAHDEAALEAADVRTLAQHYRRSDPGFASDLMAAADRHEHSARPLD